MYTPAVPICRENRLMYCVIKHIWLKGDHKASPERRAVTKAYQQLEHLVLVDDAVLAELRMPLPKINSKVVADFIKRQEKMVALRSTQNPVGVIRRIESISTAVMPDAPQQPDTLPEPSWEAVKYHHPLSGAGKKRLKRTQPAPEATVSIPPPENTVSDAPTEALVSIPLPKVPTVYVVPPNPLRHYPSSTSWARSTTTQISTTSIRQSSGESHNR